MNEEISINTDKSDKKIDNSRASIQRIELYIKITAIATSIIVMSILFLLFYFIRGILILFALAFLISYIISPVISFFEKKWKIHRLLLICFLYVLFVAGIVLLIVSLLPMLWNELKELQTGIQASLNDPEFGSTVSMKLEEIKMRLSKTFPLLENVDIVEKLDIDKGLSGVSSWILSYIAQRAQKLTTYSRKIIWFIVLIILMPFVTFFLLKDGEKIKRSLLRMILSRHASSYYELLQKIDRQIGRYIRGRIAESLILSFLTIIGLRILNIKYYLVIGSIAGFANLIPYIGPVGIGIPPVLLAGYQFGFFHMVITAIFLSGLQVIDNALIIPLVVGKSVDLHPIVTMFVVFVGGQLLGFLGMIIAVPLTSIIIVTVQGLYKEFFSSNT